jgi:hypothetical protein
MIATNKIFEFVNNQFVETNYPQYSGHTFTNNGQNYRNILTSVVPNFGAKEWVFTYSLYVQNNIDGSWSHVKNFPIVGDDHTYRDENGNLFKDSGDNEEPNNAFIYSDGQNGERIKTLKAGLTVTEWVHFWNAIFDALCRPELEYSIVNQELYGITEIV